MVAISSGDRREDVERFRLSTGPAYPILLDDGSVARAFGVESSPTCIRVEAGGRITHRGERP